MKRNDARNKEMSHLCFKVNDSVSNDQTARLALSQPFPLLRASTHPNVGSTEALLPLSHCTGRELSQSGLCLAVLLRAVNPAAPHRADERYKTSRAPLLLFTKHNRPSDPFRFRQHFSSHVDRSQNPRCSIRHRPRPRSGKSQRRTRQARSCWRNKCHPGP